MIATNNRSFHGLHLLAQAAQEYAHPLKRPSNLDHLHPRVCADAVQPLAVVRCGRVSILPAHSVETASVPGTGRAIAKRRRDVQDIVTQGQQSAEHGPLKAARTSSPQAPLLSWHVLSLHQPTRVPHATVERMEQQDEPLIAAIEHADGASVSKSEPEDVHQSVEPALTVDISASNALRTGPEAPSSTSATVTARDAPDFGDLFLNENGIPDASVEGPAIDNELALTLKQILMKDPVGDTVKIARLKGGIEAKRSARGIWTSSTAATVFALLGDPELSPNHIKLLANGFYSVRLGSKKSRDARSSDKFRVTLYNAIQATAQRALIAPQKLFDFLEQLNRLEERGRHARFIGPKKGSAVPLYKALTNCVIKHFAAHRSDQSLIGAKALSNLPYFASHSKSKEPPETTEIRSVLNAAHPALTHAFVWHDIQRASAMLSSGSN